MKRLLSGVLFLCSATLFADSHALPGGPFPAQTEAVSGKSGTTNVPIAVDSNGAVKVTSTSSSGGSSVSAPGATPSPSPAQAVNVQGTSAANTTAAANPLQSGGTAVPGSSYAPGYTAGRVAVLAVDKDSGGLLTHGRKLTRANDAVSADAQQYTTVSTFTIATADGTVFTLAAGEKGMIKNLDDAALAYKLGASASTTSLNGILSAGSVADDGKGGSVVIDDFVGVVSVAAMTGSPRFIAYKLSP